MFPFKFGFVIPKSTNNWDQTILTAEPEQMIPAEQLSGNLIVKFSFFEGIQMVQEINLRIYYD